MNNILGKLIFIKLFILISYCYLNANETLTLKLVKQDIYINEPVLATLTIRFNKDDPIIKIDFDEFEDENFWIKEIGETKKNKSKKYAYHTFNFIISPKYQGSFKIPSQTIRVAKREAKTNFILWQDLKSNDIVITAKEVPSNTELVGNYKISIDTPTITYKANKPINLTLKIDGIGNSNDIKEFDLALKDQIVFKDKPNITYKFIDGKYTTSFIQKFSIIAQDSFKLHPISFKYFNTDIQMMEIIKTNPLVFQVELSKDKNSTKEYEIYIYALCAFIVGIISCFLYKQFSKWLNYKPTEIKEKINRAKTDKELYNILLPYSKKNKINSIFIKLEENIYYNKSHKINKKDIIKEV